MTPLWTGECVCRTPHESSLIQAEPLLSQDNFWQAGNRSLQDVLQHVDHDLHRDGSTDPPGQEQKTCPVTVVPPDSGFLRARCKCGTGCAPNLGSSNGFSMVCTDVPSSCPHLWLMQPRGQQHSYKMETAHSRASIIFVPNLNTPIFCAPQIHQFCQL